MSTFLYFVPKAITTPIQSDDELIAAGLTYVGGVAGGASNHVTSGPGGVAGAIWSMPLPDGSTGPAPLYRPDAQTWRKHPSGKHWVGMMNDARPTAETLLRTGEHVDGNAVTLVDGGEWIVPVCVRRLVPGMTGMTLPRVFDLDDDNNLIATVSDEFADLAARAADYLERYVGTKESPASDRDAQFKRDVDLAADLLAVNYRVGRLEAIGMLHLLGDREYLRVVHAAIDADAIDRAIAKANADTVGMTDETPSGEPVAAGVDAK